MIAINVNVDPLPTPRPRLGRNGQVYMDANYKQYKAAIAWRAKQFMNGNITSQPVKLEITFFRKFEPTNHFFGDIDNLAKGVLDALNGVVYHDDAQVIELILHKYFSDKEGILINVFFSDEFFANVFYGKA